jgi:hypothetical protein
VLGRLVEGPFRERLGVKGASSIPETLDECVVRPSEDEITDAMNRVIEATKDAADPFTSAAGQGRWQALSGSRAGIWLLYQARAI